MAQPLQVQDEGFYVKKQVLSKSALLAFSHRRRLLMGLELTEPLQGGKRVLDYGCGDGSFIQALLGSDQPPSKVIGAEVQNELIEYCRGRLPELPCLQFAHVDELTSIASQSPFDVIVCMEVLEHIVDPQSVLDHLYSLLAIGGSVVISVPVETGPVLLVKQAVRTFVGWRGNADYASTSSYSISQYAKSMFPGANQHIVRPVYDRAAGPIHCHKGFNWRVLFDQVAKRFRVRQVLGSPIGWLPPGLGSQVWIVAEKSAA